MTRWPPRYPRIAHLESSEAVGRDDAVLTARQVRSLLAGPVLVEEKLDGANVVLWRDAATGALDVATRGGPGATDRARQLGPLRRWMGERGGALDALLSPGVALFGEWLWLAHGLRYDRLDDWLVGLDVVSPTGGWLAPDERSALLSAHGIAKPPVVYRGRLAGPDAARALLRGSRLADAPAEGIVVRALDPSRAPRLAKLVAPGFTRASDAHWRGGRPRNALSSRRSPSPAPR